jgi:hypothetical protein
LRRPTTRRTSSSFFEGRVQQFGRREGDFAVGHCAHGVERGHVERGQHVRGEHAARLARAAMHQHRQPLARQQQRQQRRQHGQLARAVVAGQHDQRAAGGRKQVQPRVRRIEEAGHLLGRLALDAHGQAETADLQVGHGAVQHLAEQVGRLFARERLGAACATADFLDVLADSHGCPDCPARLMPERRCAYACRTQ